MERIHPQWLNRTIFDALPAAAILDENGVILDTNAAWRAFGAENGITPPVDTIGTNYLRVCDTASGACSEEADEVGAGIRAVLSGALEAFELEYPCDSPTVKRWYNLRVTRFFEDGVPRLLLVHEDITRWKLTEHALVESEKRYRLLAENAIDVISRHTPEGDYLYVSASSRALVGYAPDEMIGHPCYDFFHPEDLASIRANHRRVLGHDSPLPIVYRFRHKNGDYVWFETTAKPLHHPETGVVNEIIAVSRDITERKRAEEAIRERERKYTALFDHSLDAIIIADDDGRCLDANPAACTLFSATREALIGTALQDFLPADSAARAQAWDTFLASGEMQGEFRLPQPDGGHRHVEMRARTNFLPGQHLAILRDITDRKVAENALHAAHEELEHRVEARTAELQIANEEVKSFAYIVSHDLRAPLVNIQGFVGELRRALDVIESATASLLPQLAPQQQEEVRLALHEDVPEAFDFILSAAERMDRYINAILRLSRLGRRELHLEPIDVESLIETVLKSLAHQIVERKATITLGELPAIVADRTATEQIFANILTNAVLYLDPSRPGSIDVVGERTERETVFRISDNGRGIAREDRHKVFELFRRAGKHNIKGEGMGLPYVQTLVRRHGGTIDFESELGVGTMFTFTIPHLEPETGGQDF